VSLALCGWFAEGPGEGQGCEERASRVFPLPLKEAPDLERIASWCCVDSASLALKAIPQNAVKAVMPCGRFLGGGWCGGCERVAQLSIIGREF